MKKRSLFILIPLTLMLISAKPIANANTNAKASSLADVHEYVIDLKNSRISWNIKTSRGGNNGELLIKNGKMSEENNKVLSAIIEMDMTAIKIRSIPPGVVNMKAVTILNTESFFDVTRYPSSFLDINKTVKKSENSFEVNGFLTIKGKKHPIRFLMEGQFLNDHFEGTSKNIIVNRNLYGIKYSSPDGTRDEELDAKIEEAIDRSFTIDVFIVADKKL